MMQECPKCGFTQPADQYCANCGLDIYNFKPEPDSIFKKLAKNTGLHITIVVLVVSALSVLIYLEQKNKLLTHLNPLGQLGQLSGPDQALQITTAKIADSTDATATKSAPESVTENVTENMADSAQVTDEVYTTDEKNSVVSAAANTNTKTAVNLEKAPTKRLVVTFAEISSSVLQQFANEGQIISDSSQRRAFISNNIASIDKIKERDPDFKILPGKKDRDIKVGSPLVFDFSRISSKNEEIGLNFEINPVTSTDTEIEFNLMGTLNLKDETGAALTNHEIKANFSFNTKSTLVLVGYLPHQAIRPEDQDFFMNTPLVIYDSLGFLNGITEFVIFVQAK